jgi:hypothetical protein
LATNYLYGQIYNRDWSVLRTAPGECFLKPDNPVVILRSVDGQPAAFFYPLSPTKCFMASYLPRKQKPILRVKATKLTETETIRLSLAMAAHASASVMTAIDCNSKKLEHWLYRFMGRDIHGSGPLFT